MSDFLMQKVRNTLLLLFLAFYVFNALAIDNPDAPDYVNNFLDQANLYEEKLERKTYSTPCYVRGYAEYEEFLDKELNQAYGLLMDKLDKDSKVLLKKSQRSWLVYRDTEFDFIEINWNKIDFGSSSAISKGGYRTTLIKHRVVALLHYLKNYSL